MSDRQKLWNNILGILKLYCTERKCGSGFVKSNIHLQNWGWSWFPRVSDGSVHLLLRTMSSADRLARHQGHENINATAKTLLTPALPAYISHHNITTLVQYHQSGCGRPDVKPSSTTNGSCWSHNWFIEVNIASTPKKSWLSSQHHSSVCMCVAKNTC